MKFLTSSFFNTNKFGQYLVIY